MAEKTRPPLVLVQNTTAAWRFEHADFDPSDGWSLLYAFEGPSTLNKAAVADGTGFAVSLTEADTALGVGVYVWQAFAERSTPTAERVLVAAGRMEVVLDLEASAATGQQKSFNRRMVEAIQATLEGTATAGQLSMSINGRSLNRIPLPDLMKALTYFEGRLRAEEAAEEQGAKPGRRRRIKVRF